jgi:hypothetical protein
MKRHPERRNSALFLERRYSPLAFAASLCLGIFMISPAARAAPSPEAPASLEKTFQALGASFGSKNKQKVIVKSGPTARAMLRGASPGKCWQVSLGGADFRITIEDTVKMDVKECLRRLEQVPPAYRVAFQIVSEGKKDGVAFYSDLDGAAAHGSQEYLNVIPQANALVMVHEAGHILSQRAEAAIPGMNEKWSEAIAKDGISVSPYGDTVAHEDLAEFARIHAMCLDAGPEKLAELKKLSPRRHALWEAILKLAKVE